MDPIKYDPDAKLFPDAETIDAMDKTLKAYGITGARLTAEAGVAVRSWWEWRNSLRQPSMRAWLKLTAAYHRLVQAAREGRT